MHHLDSGQTSRLFTTVAAVGQPKMSFDLRSVSDQPPMHLAARPSSILLLENGARHVYDERTCPFDP